MDDLHEKWRLKVSEIEVKPNVPETFREAVLTFAKEIEISERLSFAELDTQPSSMRDPEVWELAKRVMARFKLDSGDSKLLAEVQTIFAEDLAFDGIYSFPNGPWYEVFFILEYAHFVVQCELGLPSFKENSKSFRQVLDNQRLNRYELDFVK
jgi:hypothetical protein